MKSQTNQFLNNEKEYKYDLEECSAKFGEMIIDLSKIRTKKPPHSGFGDSTKVRSSLAYHPEISISQNDSFTPHPMPRSSARPASRSEAGEHGSTPCSRSEKSKCPDRKVVGAGFTQQKTRLAASYLKLNISIKPTAKFNFFGGSTCAETNLSSKNNISYKYLNVNHIEDFKRGPEGNRTPGTKLDRFIPHQAGPTKLKLVLQENLFIVNSGTNV